MRTAWHLAALYLYQIVAALMIAPCSCLMHASGLRYTAAQRASFSMGAPTEWESRPMKDINKVGPTDARKAQIQKLMEKMKERGRAGTGSLLSDDLDMLGASSSTVESTPSARQGTTLGPRTLSSETQASARKR